VVVNILAELIGNEIVFALREWISKKLGWNKPQRKRRSKRG